MTAEQEAEVIQIRQEPRPTPAGLGVEWFDTIPMKRLHFLDEFNMIPLGLFTVMFGPTMLGKSTYGAAIAAAVTRGHMPGLDGPRRVLISSTEDEPSFTQAPRLQAAGADRSLVGRLTGLRFPSGLDLLREQVKATNAALVLIDPITAHLDDSIDSHKVASVRSVTDPINELAGELGIAIVAVAHPNKSGGDATSRMSGSQAWADAPRSVIAFGVDPADPEGRSGDKRIIGHLGCNVGKVAPSQSATIETVELISETDPPEPVTTSKLVLTGESSVDAETILDSRSSEERTQRDEAREFLEGMITDVPIRSKELRTAATDAGIAWRTVETAKKELQLKSVKKADGWYTAPADWEES